MACVFAVFDAITSLKASVTAVRSAHASVATVYFRSANPALF